ADRHPPQPDSATTSETSPPTTPSRATDAACRAQLRLRAGGPRQLPPIVEGRRPTRAPRQLSLDFATHSPTTSGYRHLSLDRTHGIVGYLLAVPDHERLMNPLMWRLMGEGPKVDLLKEVVPEQFQPVATAF